MITISEYGRIYRNDDNRTVCSLFVCLIHVGACVSIDDPQAICTERGEDYTRTVSSNTCMSRTMVTHGAPTKVIQPTTEGDGRILNTPFTGYGEAQHYG